MKRFEHIGPDARLNPEQATQIEGLVENHAQEKLRELTEISIVPEQRVWDWTLKLQEKYRQEYIALANEAPEPIAVLFFPEDAKDQVGKIIGYNISEDTLGRFSTLHGAVLVFTKEGELESFNTAKLLAHELAHAYGKVKIQHVLQEKDGAPFIKMANSTMGAALKTDTKELGAGFEETYADQREIEALPDLKEAFPSEYAEYEKGLQLLQDMGQDPQLFKYRNVNFQSADYTHSPISNYASAHIVFSNLLNSIEQGWEMFKKVRVTNKWADLSRAIDAKYGIGTFKLAMHVDPVDVATCDNLQTYLTLKPDDYLREQIKAAILNEKPTRT